MTKEEAITRLHWLKRELIKGTDMNEPIDMAIEALQDRPKGEWIESEMDKDFRVCSVCKNKGYKDKMAWRTEFIKSYLNFCPNCGARMKGGDDE